MNIAKTCATAALGALSAVAGAQETVRVSTTEQGFQLDNATFEADVSADARYVAMTTAATNLSAFDYNGSYDVWVKDHASGALRLVSRALGTGIPASGTSEDPRISADGGVVAFTSDANNLVGGDTNGVVDVFVLELESNVLERVSVASGGLQGDLPSDSPSLSADGRHVAFRSGATNLVPGDANGVADIFVHDRVTGLTELVSRTTSGAQAAYACRNPSISGDGQRVVFSSGDPNLVLGDTNGVEDIFLRDRGAGTTTRVSLTSSGAQLNASSGQPSLSSDGRFLAFSTDASNIALIDTNGVTDVCVKDLQTGMLRLVSRNLNLFYATADSWSYLDAISRNGRYVVFSSHASNLVAGDLNAAPDVFRWDRATGTNERMSLSDAGLEVSDASYGMGVSDDGQVAFSSSANDLVTGDSANTDVFVRNTGPDFPRLYCSGKTSSAGCVPFMDFSGIPSVSATGPFSVRGRDFLPGESGFLIYGVNGKSNLDFHGGKLCVKLPFRRWLPFKKAQSAGGGCSGVLTRNFNARIQAGVDPLLTAGQVVHAQWLQRDPGDPAGFGEGLSNGLRFTIGG